MSLATTYPVANGSFASSADAGADDSAFIFDLPREMILQEAREWEWTASSATLRDDEARLLGFVPELPWEEVKSSHKLGTPRHPLRHLSDNPAASLVLSPLMTHASTWKRNTPSPLRKEILPHPAFLPLPSPAAFSAITTISTTALGTESGVNVTSEIATVDAAGNDETASHAGVATSAKPMSRVEESLTPSEAALIETWVDPSAIDAQAASSPIDAEAARDTLPSTAGEEGRHNPAEFNVDSAQARQGALPAVPDGQSENVPVPSAERELAHQPSWAPTETGGSDIATAGSSLAPEASLHESEGLATTAQTGLVTEIDPAHPENTRSPTGAPGGSSDGDRPTAIAQPRPTAEVLGAPDQTASATSTSPFIPGTSSSDLPTAANKVILVHASASTDSPAASIPPGLSKLDDHFNGNPFLVSYGPRRDEYSRDPPLSAIRGDSQAGSDADEGEKDTEMDEIFAPIETILPILPQTHHDLGMSKDLHVQVMDDEMPSPFLRPDDVEAKRIYHPARKQAPVFLHRNLHRSASSNLSNFALVHAQSETPVRRFWKKSLVNNIPPVIPEHLESAKQLDIDGSLTSLGTGNDDTSLATAYIEAEMPMSDPLDLLMAAATAGEESLQPDPSRYYPTAIEDLQPSFLRSELTTIDDEWFALNQVHATPGRLTRQLMAESIKRKFTHRAATIRDLHASPTPLVSFGGIVPSAVIPQTDDGPHGSQGGVTESSDETSLGEITPHKDSYRRRRAKLKARAERREMLKRAEAAERVGNPVEEDVLQVTQSYEDGEIAEKQPEMEAGAELWVVGMDTEASQSKFKRFNRGGMSMRQMKLDGLVGDKDDLPLAATQRGEIAVENLFGVGTSSRQVQIGYGYSSTEIDSMSPLAKKRKAPAMIYQRNMSSACPAMVPSKRTMTAALATLVPNVRRVATSTASKRGPPADEAEGEDIDERSGDSSDVANTQPTKKSKRMSATPAPPSEGLSIAESAKLRRSRTQAAPHTSAASSTITTSTRLQSAKQGNAVKWTKGGVSRFTAASNPGKVRAAMNKRAETVAAGGISKRAKTVADGGIKIRKERNESEDPLAGPQPHPESVAVAKDDVPTRRYTDAELNIIVDSWSGAGPLTGEMLWQVRQNLIDAGYAERSVNALKWYIKNTLKGEFETKVAKANGAHGVKDKGKKTRV